MTSIPDAPPPSGSSSEGEARGDEGGLSGRLSVHLIQSSGDPGPGHPKVVLFQTRVCVRMCVCIDVCVSRYLCVAEM